jgi:hypothetical protein
MGTPSASAATDLYMATLQLLVHELGQPYSAGHYLSWRRWRVGQRTRTAQGAVGGPLPVRVSRRVAGVGGDPSVWVHVPDGPAGFVVAHLRPSRQEHLPALVQEVRRLMGPVEPEAALSGGRMGLHFRSGPDGEEPPPIDARHETPHRA